MKKKEIQNIIFNAIEMTNNMREDHRQIPLTETTELYGNNGHLDSMGLVAFLIDIEECLLDEELEITLSDEKAMSQSKSPFRNVQTLISYIDSCIKDLHHGN
ncbi:MAG: hypothetical protein HRT37_20740 [Alteromonadaceae bacterium]|nr:hypothetical protein [Alteromonadaceae bacterium]